MSTEMNSAKEPAKIRLFNTMKRVVEPLKPLQDDQVGVYCCGPTVYNYQHIGNLRTYVFEDVLVRALRYAGYEVKHVMNITDVGHLVSDADDGEDKMLLAAKREGKKSEELAQYYTDIFFKHCDLLNIKRPDVVCKATEHIAEMIALVQRLEQRGLAYQSGGNVYFDVSKLPDYGKLARLDLESLKAGARIDVDQDKKNPLDFALWFTRSKFENQELQWDSPWGRGYPGWHIECSAMSMNYLGESFDIHCGGIDHIPVHHTNEIAQSEGASGRPFAQIWMHGGFLVLGKDKMSKSSGEFLTLDVLTERGIDPTAYRLFCFSGSYRQELSWSWQALEASASALRRLKNGIIAVKEQESLPASITSEKPSELKRRFEAAVFEDLNMPMALSVVFEALGDSDTAPGEKLALFLQFDEILGLGMDRWEPEKAEVPEHMVKLLKEREQARKEKDWKKADAVRDQIIEAGYRIEDSAEGPKIKKQ